MNLVLLAGLILLPGCALVGVLFARFMRHRSLGQAIRDVGPAGHAIKAGTPTMGGAVLLVLWIAAVLLLFIRHQATATASLVLTAGSLFAAIGAADDLISLRRARSLGLSPLAKLALSSAASAILFFAFRDPLSTPMLIPFTSESITIPPAALFFLTWFVFLSAANGMNLTDGLDGLATGIAGLILLGIVLLRPTEANLILCVPLIAALVGFLWINAHPAGLFLGDIGSFFLGGVVAALALANGLAFLLPILAGVLVFEAASVILQVASLRATGRRLFRMSPLHHHFERALGTRHTHILPAFEWSEGRIVLRFWVLQGAFVLLALYAGGFGG